VKVRECSASDGLGQITNRAMRGVNGMA